MEMKISICNNKQSAYSKNWSIQSTFDLKELIQIIKTSAYSNTYFKDNKRSQENILGYHRFLILDIDNDDEHFTINDCQKNFNNLNVFSIILPSKSHLKEKNGVVKERYRVFCNLDQDIPSNISKEQYKIMMQLIVKDLNMQNHVDNKALFDRSRFYYPSKNLDETYIKVTRGSSIKLNHYLDKSNEIIQEQLDAKIDKLKNQHRFKDIDSLDFNIVEYLVYKDIYQYNISEMSFDVDFTEIIDEFENIQKIEENNKGYKIKTDEHNTYQYFEDNNILYDFKNEKSYNVITYIMNIDSCSNIQALNKLDDYVDIEAYKTVSESWQNAVESALFHAKNAKDFKNSLIDNVKFDLIDIHRNQEDIIIVKGKKYHISDFELSNYTDLQDIIRQFQQNRRVQ